MNLSNVIRQHWAARALVLTVIVGIGYPCSSGWWHTFRPQRQSRWIHHRSQWPSVASRLIGQHHRRQGQRAPPVLSKQAVGRRCRIRPDGQWRVEPRPGERRRHTRRPSEPAGGNGYAASLLTQVCTRSKDIGDANGVDGSRPFCTPGGVGAVLAVMGPRDARGTVVTRRG